MTSGLNLDQMRYIARYVIGPSEGQGVAYQLSLTNSNYLRITVTPHLIIWDYGDTPLNYLGLKSRAT
jgi:hypothetical protein